jgi:beta-glucosidase
MKRKNASTDVSAVYEDHSRPIDERVDALVSAMTLEEAISQMVYDAPAIERLGVPAYNWWNECLHGVARAGIATVFPQAIGLAATWDTELMHTVAVAISDEARAKHHEAWRVGGAAQYLGLTYWSPNVNLFRDPRWGRGQETYGECPYLTARMGVAFVKGLQGDDEKHLKVVATPKHYAVHSGPEVGRHSLDAVVDERDLRLSYLPHFEACVREAGAFSAMGAYNRVNGEPCCASPRLLQRILREEWDFAGYVVSDCGAIEDIYAHHKVVATAAEAAAAAVKAGCDLNCGKVYPALLEAVEKELIDEETIRRSVRRLFTARFRLGMFDPQKEVAYAKIPYQVVDSPAHKELARKAARESIVLLKNDKDLLPLRKDLGSIAVIGPNADDRSVLLANYNGTPSHAVTVLEGIREGVSPETRVYHARGCGAVDGRPPLDPVPPSCLRPDGRWGGPVGTGLSGSYYDNPVFEGEPTLQRIDPEVDFSWRATTPISGRAGDHFSVVWTGYLIPPVSGKYGLGVEGCEKYALYLDGERLVDLDLWYSPLRRVAEVELEAGRLYRLRLEYAHFRRDYDSRIRLVWEVPGTDLLEQAVEVARKAEVVIAVLGLSAVLEGEEMPVDVPGFRGGDRTDIRLPAVQEELLKRIHKLGKPTVLVLMSGGALASQWAADKVPAIVHAWYPGQAGGEAIADVLFGDYNPAARLPVTFYGSVDDLPPFEDYCMEGRTYRYFRGEPLYPFGYGLSYTRFEYRNLQLSAETVSVEELESNTSPIITVSVDVRNVGQRAGDEVVQVYVSDAEASVPTPIRQLAAFRRIHLAPGENQRVTLPVQARQLSLIDEQGRCLVEPGTFEVAVGGGQPGTDSASISDVLTATFEVSS